jgi:hypothetical protein
VKAKTWLILGTAIFFIYFFAAARPVPPETVLIPLWLSSTETDLTVPLVTAEATAHSLQTGIPFRTENNFGYIDRGGNFIFKKALESNISLSAEYWAEYDSEPDQITVYNPSGETYAVIDNPRGYPFFLDGRCFLVNSEQNALAEIDRSGAAAWTYDFSGQLTCVDAAASLLVTGSLDGIVTILDNKGKPVFIFEPGASRYPVILGCAISRNGTRVALVAGIDGQRFILLEKFGASPGEYKVVYHEFLEGGFRRPVHVSFAEDDRWVIFERSGGFGVYEIGSRRLRKVRLDGEIQVIDRSGNMGIVFSIVSRSLNENNEKELVGIKLPGKVMLEMPFKSGDVFFDRIDSQLLIGGGQTLISFDIGKR